jgi:Flp pilus assembly protein TadG
MSRAASRRRAHSGELGAVAVEAVLLLPVVLLVLGGLVLAGGRLMLARQGIITAASEAARTASISRTEDAAARGGREAAAASIRNQAIRCVPLDVVIDTSGFDAPAGEQARVSATVTCRVPFGDLSVPGLPGSTTVRVTVDSPLDTYRER